MIKDESGLVTADIEDKDEHVVEIKDAQIEEKRPWKRNERYRRKVTLVGCAVCHSLRGTMRRDPMDKSNKDMYCENCWPVVMQKKYGGKIIAKK